MASVSAGICLWRTVDGVLQVLIAHPGGPFWAKKDEGAWSFPKGEYEPGVEDPLVAARREFHEETGGELPDSDAIALGETRLKSGKTVLVWAVEGTFDPEALVSNHFEMSWPPRSGRKATFPEIDRVLWCDLATAAAKLNAAQVVFLDRLAEHLGD